MTGWSIEPKKGDPVWRDTDTGDVVTVTPATFGRGPYLSLRGLIHDADKAAILDRLLEEVEKAIQTVPEGPIQGAAHDSYVRVHDFIKNGGRYGREGTGED